MVRHQKLISAITTNHTVWMPRRPCADESGGIYHVLNRANLRATIVTKELDFAAFEHVLHEGLALHQSKLYFHVILRPLVVGEMGHVEPVG